MPRCLGQINTAMSTNPTLELAFDYVAYTNRHIFLTGKAGTGKTTFLHRVKREVTKRCAVVAPTGVAAINAGAQTIHSLFSLPLGFIEPGRPVRRGRRLSRKKTEVLQSIDLLIIDEISMVRADVLDAVDSTLKQVRGNARPFGGVQLLMIGDLHQLPPVVTRSEEDLVRKHYASPYYFAAKVMGQAKPAAISLSHIYRQADVDFISLLNKVRDNQMDDTVIRQLNTRYQSPERIPRGDGFITLTSHNRNARAINERMLGDTPGKAFKFEAEIKGDFPPSMYPNDKEISFKIGAQVMFNRNDTQEQRYYNGKIGKITSIKDGLITVQCRGEEEPIQVAPVTWENIKYGVGEANHEMKENVVGHFTQHPLRLAWAITIHKSQGLTFDKVIIDAADSFSHGQVYVALSRCKTFAGIVLRSKIGRKSVLTDQEVANHSADAVRNRPTTEQLAADKKRFQLACLEELFDFQPEHELALSVSRLVNNPVVRLKGDGIKEFSALMKSLEASFFKVGRGFQPTLKTYASYNQPPEDSPEIQARLAKAAHYFNQQFAGGLGDRLQEFTFLCDNNRFNEQIDDALGRLRKAYFVKQQLFTSLADGFSALNYTAVRTSAQLKFDQLKNEGAKGSQKEELRIPRSLKDHPLYIKLAKWRYQLAKEKELPTYRILPNSVLHGITQDLPTNERALRAIKGFGPRRLGTYGEDILRMVRQYAHQQRLPGKELNKSPRTVVAAPTLQQTLRALRAGQTVPAIAVERKLKVGTVYDHALKWMRTGELSLKDVFTPARLSEIQRFTAGASLLDIGILHARCNGRFTLGELRLVLTPVIVEKVVA